MKNKSVIVVVKIIQWSLGVIFLIAAAAYFSLHWVLPGIVTIISALLCLPPILGNVWTRIAGTPLKAHIKYSLVAISVVIGLIVPDKMKPSKEEIAKRESSKPSPIVASTPVQNDKYGLTEEERIKIYLEMSKLSDKAYKEASIRYKPTDKRRDQYLAKMAEKNTSLIASRNDIRDSIVELIYIEGAQKAWTRIEVEHKKNIAKRVFSSWDGSQPSVSSYIKDHIKDPDSYKHLETRFEQGDSTFDVITKFTATNSFGARVTGYCKATVDTLGNLIKAKIVE